MSGTYELDDDGGLVLAVHAQPGAGRSHLVGRHGDALKVRIAVPPVNDRANIAIAALLAEHFGVKDKDVTLVSGAKNREKRFRITGLDPEEVDRLVASAMDSGNSVPARGVREPRPPVTNP